MWFTEFQGNKIGRIVPPPVSTLPQVVEFYNVNLDNYFITASAAEQSAIDNGSAGPGWSRTGATFASAGNTQVCRFYGSIAPGPNSHFYTADANECAQLKQIQATTPATQKRWNFESNDFRPRRQPTEHVRPTCCRSTARTTTAFHAAWTATTESRPARQRSRRSWRADGRAKAW